MGQSKSYINLIRPCQVKSKKAPATKGLNAAIEVIWGHQNLEHLVQYKSKSIEKCLGLPTVSPMKV